MPAQNHTINETLLKSSEIHISVTGRKSGRTNLGADLVCVR
jgi:hypothetical protein